MNDIEPWLESGASAEVVESLRAARAEKPRDEVIERCAALVVGGVAIAATAAHGTPLAGGSSLVGASSGTGVLGLLKWGAGGLLAGTVFATSAHVVQLTNTPSVGGPPSEVATASPAVAGSATPVPVAPQALPAPPAAAVVPTANVSSSSTARPETRAASPSPDARFAEELALIERVRASVDARNSALASSLLAEHERRFGKTAQLAPEARYLRLEVLIATKRPGEAQSLAREILARDPKGPHAARARAVLQEK